MSFPRYPEYKCSGVEWLGDVPAHWDVAPLKKLIRKIESGVSVNAIDTPATGLESGVLKTSCVYRGEFDPEENKAVVQDEYSRLACPVTAGTLIVSRMNTPELVGAAGLVRRSEENLFLPDRLWQVHFKDADAGYIHYWSRTPFYRALVQVACEGTSSSMQNLSQEDFRNFAVATPGKAEQVEVRNFLDHETAKIDALVAEQENLMKLLKEKRQAVISHAVTKGLDPAVPMKDSGVDWLGEVPAHWEILPLKRDLAFLTSGSRGWAEHYADHGALFIRIGNLTRDEIGLDLSDIQYVDVPIGAEGERTVVRPGDVLFSITAYLGSVAVVPPALDKAYVSQHVALARLRKEKLSPEWVAYVTKSIVGSTYLESQGYGGTKIQLSLGDIANMPMLIPSVSEQKSIVKHISDELEKFDSLLVESRRNIEILKERRASLISAAVTGKIDVRGLVENAVV